VRLLDEDEGFFADIVTAAVAGSLARIGWSRAASQLLE
jgi:hypothetical protein